MTAPHYWQDARLKKALENAPDFQATPSTATQNEILKTAAIAIAEPKPTLSSWWKSILNQFVEKANFSRNAGFATAIVIICVGVIWTVGDLMKSLDPLSSQEVPTSTVERSPVIISPSAVSEPSVVADVEMQVELANTVITSSFSEQDAASNAVPSVSQTQAVTPNASSAQLPLQSEPVSTTSVGATVTENSIILRNQVQADQARANPSSRAERERAVEEAYRMQALARSSIATAGPVMIQDNLVADSPSAVDNTNFARDARIDNSERDYRVEITDVPILAPTPVYEDALASEAVPQRYAARAPRLQTESEAIAEPSVTRQLDDELYSEKPQQNTERTVSSINYDENLPFPAILSGGTTTSASVPATEQTITAMPQNEMTEVDAQRNDIAILEETNRSSAMLDAQLSAQRSSAQTERTDYIMLVHTIYVWDELYLTSPSFGTTVIYRQSAKDLQTWLSTIISQPDKTLPQMSNNQSVWLLTFYQKSEFLGTMAIQGQKWVFSTTYPCQLECKLPENPSLGGIFSEEDAKMIEQSMNSLMP